MHWCLLATLLVVVEAAKLDRTYLPPASAKTADGSSADLEAPFAYQTPQADEPHTRSQLNRGNQGLGGIPSGGFANDHQGVVVEAAEAGTRNAGETGLGGPRASYGSHASKVGADAFKAPEQRQDKTPAELPSRSGDRDAEIVRFDSDVGPHGYKYLFETDNGISAEEMALAANGVQAQGSFSYTGDDGEVYSVMYTADENGYRPIGSHLPTPPPIPEAILRSLERNAQDEANGVSDDGSYDARKYNSGDYKESDNANGDKGKQSQVHGNEAASSNSAATSLFVNENGEQAFGQNQQASSGSGAQENQFNYKGSGPHDGTAQQNKQYSSQASASSSIQNGDRNTLMNQRKYLGSFVKNFGQHGEESLIDIRNNNFGQFGSSTTQKTEQINYSSPLVEQQNEHYKAPQTQQQQNEQINQASIIQNQQPSNQLSSLDKDTFFTQPPAPILNVNKPIFSNQKQYGPILSNHGFVRRQPQIENNQKKKFGHLQASAGSAYYPSASTVSPVLSTDTAPRETIQHFSSPVDGVTQAAAYPYSSSLSDNRFSFNIKASPNNPRGQFQQSMDTNLYQSTETLESSGESTTENTYNGEIYEYNKPEQSLPAPDSDKGPKQTSKSDNANDRIDTGTINNDNLNQYYSGMSHFGMKLIDLPLFEQTKHKSYYHGNSFRTSPQTTQSPQYYGSYADSNQNSQSFGSDSQDNNTPQSFRPNVQTMATPTSYDSDVESYQTPKSFGSDGQSNQTPKPFGSDDQSEQTTPQSFVSTDAGSRSPPQYFGSDTLNYNSQYVAYDSEAPNLSTESKFKNMHDSFRPYGSTSVSLVNSNRQSSAQSSESMAAYKKAPLKSFGFELRNMTPLSPESSIFDAQNSQYAGPPEIFAEAKAPPSFDENGYHY